MTAPKNKTLIQHRLDLDALGGDEFVAGGDDLFSPDFFIQYASDTTYDARYNQLEFEKDF